MPGVKKPVKMQVGGTPALSNYAQSRAAIGEQRRAGVREATDLYKQQRQEGNPQARANFQAARANTRQESREARSALRDARNEARSATDTPTPAMKKGGMVKSSASKRADGIAVKGKTKGRFV